MKIKKFLLIHVLLGAVLAFLTASFYTQRHGWAVFLGCAMGAFVAALFGFAWHFGARKKNIALALGVIVIKYALLGAGLFVILRVWKMDPLAFSLGISTLAVSAILSTKV